MSLKSKIGSMLPEGTKNRIKKLLGQEVNAPQSKLSPEQKRRKELEKELKRPISIKGNVTYEKPRALKSRVWDAFYEEQLQSGNYTWEDPLVVVNPYELAPLTALVLFRTQEKCSVRFTVPGKNPVNDVTGTVKAANDHRVPVVGLYAETLNQVKLELLGEDGRVLREKTIEIQTKSLPKVLREDVIKIRQHKVKSAFNLHFVMGGGDIMPFAFDDEGDVRYYLNCYSKGYGIFLMSNGHLIFPEKYILAPGYANPHSSQIHDMDMFGRVYKTYHLEEGAHHDACEMEAGGNILLCSSSFRDQCEDRVVEIDRKTGKAVWTLDMCDIVESKYHDMKDWAHVNTVQYLEDEDAVLICMRNLHGAAKVDKKTKELLWVMGDPRFWDDTPVKDKVLRPIGEVHYHFQSHTARMLEEDLDGNPDTKHMIIFDNHWHKRRSVSFFDNDPNSFVDIYTINEKEGTVEQFKRFICPKSKIRSNGIMVLDQKRVYAMEGFLEPMIDDYPAMIREYDYETGELYNEFLVKKGFYRAWECKFDYDQLSERLPEDRDYFTSSLIPPVEISDFETSVGAYPSEVLEESEEVKYKRSEDKFYAYAQDHKIHKIYLVGKNHVYVKDYTNTTQGNPVFAERYYYVVVELAGLMKDEYRICIDYEGTLYDTQKVITVE